MANLPGDTGSGPAGLPKPPTIPGSGLDGIVRSFNQLRKLMHETAPYLSKRLAADVNNRRAG